jgi:hypothetical protein
MIDMQLLTLLLFIFVMTKIALAIGWAAMIGLTALIWMLFDYLLKEINAVEREIIGSLKDSCFVDIEEDD